MHKFVASVLLLLAGVSAISADGTGPFNARVEVPGADIWMYPHGGGGGSRTSASTFSALPQPASSSHSEDRFAQFVLRFDTVSIPTDLGAQNYLPEKVVLTAVILQGGVPYDPTEDSRLTYLPTGEPGATPDTDVGRPIELYGTGFRGGATDATFNEESPFGPGDIHGRSAYAMGFSPEAVARDVSHNVTEGIDPAPWAVGRVLVPGEGGQYVELEPGSIIPNEVAHVEFELNLALPGVADYVRAALHKGYAWFTISSLHSTTEMAENGYPSFYTKENAEQVLFGDVAATLEVDYSLPIRILSFSRDAVAGSAAIDWNGSPGYEYELQRSEELTEGSWFPVVTRTLARGAAATTLSWSGSSASPKAFYRVIRNPLPILPPP